MSGGSQEGDRPAQTGTAGGDSSWPALMRAAQAGDQRAYGQVLTRAVPLVRNMVRRRISDQNLVEDVVQDVLLTIHRVRHTYDPLRPFEPWVAAVAAARSVDAQRRSGRVRRREISDDDMLEREADRDAERSADALAARSEVDSLLAQLPDRQREAVQMVKLRELSLDEAAQAGNLSVSAMKALIHRAMTRLRELERNGDA